MVSFSSVTTGSTFGSSVFSSSGPATFSSRAACCSVFSASLICRKVVVVRVGLQVKDEDDVDKEQLREAKDEAAGVKAAAEAKVNATTAAA